MTIHPYKDWPMGHRRILLATAAVLVLFLLGLWLHLLPKWRDLYELSNALEDDTKAWEKSNYPMDALTLQNHLDDCTAQLVGAPGKPGLGVLAQQALEKASRTFWQDIHTAYPVNGPVTTMSSEKAFIASANRIDFKDLYDRINTWLASEGYQITLDSLKLDEEGYEPVYQLMLKLWTIRNVTQLALKHNLKPVVGRDGVNAAIHASKTVAYAISTKDTTPYLLELPVWLKVDGTMEDFLDFVGEMQTENHFTPITRLVITSAPPQKIAPGETVHVKRMTFAFACSAFFKMPDKK